VELDKAKATHFHLYSSIFSSMMFFDNCEKYGVSIGNKLCCGGLFADDISLVAP